MNSVNLYVKTTRLILQAKHAADDPRKWADIKQLVVLLRQSLTCCVCGNLLVEPHSSTVSTCQHYVCKGCLNGKIKLKPSCTFCKDHSKFAENVQLRILLQCYKRLCDTMEKEGIPVKWGTLKVNCAPAISTGVNQSHGVGMNISGPTHLDQVIVEGANFPDHFDYSEVMAQPALVAKKERKKKAKKQICAQPAMTKITMEGAMASVAKKPVTVAKNVLHLPIKTPPVTKGSPSVTAPVAKITPIHPVCSNPTPGLSAIKVEKMMEPTTTNGQRVVTLTMAPQVTTQGPFFPTNKAIVTSSAPPNPQTLFTNANALVNGFAGTTTTTTTILTQGDSKDKSLINTKGTTVTATHTPNGTFLVATYNGTAPMTPTVVKDTNNYNTSETPNGKNAASDILSASTPKKSKKKTGCRCGLATANPGKLTCCGQRCPCYVDGKGCFDCKCRGCRNPHRANTNSGIPVTPAVKPSPPIQKGTGDHQLPPSPPISQLITLNTSSPSPINMGTPFSSGLTPPGYNNIFHLSPTVTITPNPLTTTSSSAAPSTVANDLNLTLLDDLNDF